MQEVVNNIVINNTMVENLEAIKEELVNETLTKQENGMIEAITEQIEENIEEILNLDRENLPDFGKIKEEWLTATTKVYELQTMTNMMKEWKRALKGVREEIMKEVVTRTKRTPPVPVTTTETTETSATTRTIKTEKPTTTEAERDDNDEDNGNNGEEGSGHRNREEEGTRQPTRYENAVAWANEVMEALEPIGITPKAAKGLGITIIATWTTGTMIAIGLIVQVARLTRRMRRVRETIDLKMSRKKQALKDEAQFEAMNTKLREKHPDPYNFYIPNPQRKGDHRNPGPDQSLGGPGDGIRKEHRK